MHSSDGFRDIRHYKILLIVGSVWKCYSTEPTSRFIWLTRVLRRIVFGSLFYSACCSQLALACPGQDNPCPQHFQQPAPSCVELVTYGLLFLTQSSYLSLLPKLNQKVHLEKNYKYTCTYDIHIRVLTSINHHEAPNQARQFYWFALYIFKDVTPLRGLNYVKQTSYHPVYCP